MTDSIQTTMPVTPAGYGDSGGFGGFGGGWGIWILLFFVIFAGGWGNGGLGGNNSSLPGYSQVNDFSSLERENDIIRSDICDGFSNTNQLLANGFQTIQTSFANAELSRSNTQAAIMGQMYQQNLTALQQSNDISRQMGDGFCQTNYNNSNNTRDVIEAINAEGRATRDMLMAQRIEDKDARIADLTTQLNNANLRASQAAQTNAIQDYVGEQFRQYNPTPIPSYSVPAPYQYGNCGCGMG